MGLRERLIELTSEEQVIPFLKEHPICAFFKAGGCHKTMQGFGYVEQALDERESIPLAVVRVIENRPVSNLIQALTGIVHQSPQFILLIDGKPVFDVDNWNITPEILESALLQHLGPVEQKEDLKEACINGISLSDVQPYLSLLKSFISGTMLAQEFKNQWLLLFQMDASLRSSQEFGLLNSLFGDVDHALQKDPLGSSECSTSTTSLRTKAENLLQNLEALQ